MRVKNNNIRFLDHFNLNTDIIYKTLKSLLTSEVKGRLLESGCGTGIRTLYLAKMNAIELAKMSALKLKVNPHYILGDVRFLPFKDNCFDITWNEGVNEHFDGLERQVIFDEMTRVTKINSKVIVFVPNALDLLYRTKKLLEELVGKWEYEFEKPFTPFELNEKMKKAGLKVIYLKRDWLKTTLYHCFITFKKILNLKRSNASYQSVLDQIEIVACSIKLSSANSQGDDLICVKR